MWSKASFIIIQFIVMWSHTDSHRCFSLFSKNLREWGGWSENEQVGQERARSERQSKNGRSSFLIHSTLSPSIALVVNKFPTAFIHAKRYSWYRRMKSRVLSVVRMLFKRALKKRNNFLKKVGKRVILPYQSGNSMAWHKCHGTRFWVINKRNFKAFFLVPARRKN